MTGISVRTKARACIFLQNSSFSLPPVPQNIALFPQSYFRHAPFFLTFVHNPYNPRKFSHNASSSTTALTFQFELQFPPRVGDVHRHTLPASRPLPYESVHSANYPNTPHCHHRTLALLRCPVHSLGRCQTRSQLHSYGDRARAHHMEGDDIGRPL